MPAQSATLYYVKGGQIQRLYRPSLTASTQTRDDLIPGTYEADEDNTGTITGISRTTYSSGTVDANGMRVISTNGAVYPNLDFMEDVVVTGPNNTFINCKVRGNNSHPGANRGCFTLTGNANHNNTKFIDCDADPRHPSYHRDGWVGNSYEALRCRVIAGNDGFGAFSHPSGSGACNVSLLGCYADLVLWWSVDPLRSPPGSTHNDIVQYQGGSGFIVRGCTLIGYCEQAPADTGNPKGDDYAGACVQINQNTHIASGVIIEDNILRRAKFGQINIHRNGYSTVKLTIRRNRFGRDIFNHGSSGSPDRRWVMINQGGVGHTHTGLYPGANDDNRYEDTNALLSGPSKTLGIRVGS